jgi:uncharacterized phage infection (PIP) family protein YhgE
MTELNKEQEAFLAYMDASKKSLEGLNKTSEAFQNYMDASKTTTNAYQEYVRLQTIEAAAYDAYSVVSAISNGHTDDANRLHGEWVKIRGY